MMSGRSLRGAAGGSVLGNRAGAQGRLNRPFERPRRGGRATVGVCRHRLRRVHPVRVPAPGGGASVGAQSFRESRRRPGRRRSDAPPPGEQRMYRESADCWRSPPRSGSAPTPSAGSSWSSSGTLRLVLPRRPKSSVHRDGSDHDHDHDAPTRCANSGSKSSIFVPLLMTTTPRPRSGYRRMTFQKPAPAPKCSTHGSESPVGRRNQPIP
jgi:hypothetical protein